MPLLLNANVWPGVAGSKTGGAEGGGGLGLGKGGSEGAGSGRDEGGKTRRRGRNGNKMIAKAEMRGERRGIVTAPCWAKICF